MTEALTSHLPDLAIAAALAWGAGLRLYLVVFLFGLAGFLGAWPLPSHLTMLAHPAVLAAAGFMAFVELFADKLPWLDSVWDLIHTFIRIPAGAALAAALLGGSLSATSHFAKAGTRAVANTSPEPFSNLALSFGEDVAVTGGAALAVANPGLFLALLMLFVIGALAVIVVVLRGARRLFARPAVRGAG